MTYILRYFSLCILMTGAVSSAQTDDILSDFLHKKVTFDFSGNQNVFPHIVAYAQPPGKQCRVTFEEDSGIFNQMFEHLKRLLLDSVIPDMQSIKKHTQFYSVPRLTNEPDSLSDGYDIAYLPMTAGTLDILITFTGDQIEGSTCLYIKPSSRKKQEDIDVTSALKTLLTPDACKIVYLVDNVSKFPKQIEMSSESRIPVFIGKDCFCVVRPNYFPTEGLPKRGIFFTDWFSTCKKWDKNGKEQNQIRQKYIDQKRRIVAEREAQCKEWIVTEAGRVKLIALLASKEGRKEFENDPPFEEWTYREKFQGLPFFALKDYYRHYKDAKAEQKAATYSAWKYDKITPPEAEALRKLLESDDLQVKCDALRLIQAGNGHCLVPDVLKLSNDKEQVTKEMAGGVPYRVVGDSEEPRVYHFFVYEVLGCLGNARTLKSLEQLRRSDKISAEAKEDAVLAIEDINRHLEYEHRQKQNWLDLRRQVREKKMIVLGMVDMDKPDPEPVTAKGFRRWETTDGLFKTTAKFVAIKKIGNGKEDDVRLLRHDGKEVTIEYSALRKIDHEYIRQQLEPLRNWSTAAGSIKAKLLGKFDTEIILEEPDGITTFIQIDKLSDTDKEYLKRVPISPHSKYVF